MTIRIIFSSMIYLVGTTSSLPPDHVWGHHWSVEVSDREAQTWHHQTSGQDEHTTEIKHQKQLSTDNSVCVLPLSDPGCSTGSQGVLLSGPRLLGGGKEKGKENYVYSCV